MAVDYPFGFGDRTAPQFLALAAAATLPVVLLLSTMMPTAGAAEQRLIIAGNSSLCGSINGDAGCLAIARAQPELEGFEMTADLGSGVVPRRSLAGGYPSETYPNQIRGKANCGRYGPDGRYYPCTTPPGQIRPDTKCDPFRRDKPCHP